MDSFTTFPAAFAVWHPDDNIRRASSSGGAFTLLAERVLQEGGVVFGAAWDDQLNVKIVAAESKEDLTRFRGSKYVFSDAIESYSEVIRHLRDGRIVLYSGAPCQIAALRKALKDEDDHNLLTVDFICHGMPERRVFQKYIKHLEMAYGDQVVSVAFRDKRYGVEANLLLKIGFRRLGERIITGKKNSYYHGFIHNVFMRNCCASCSFNLIPRCADISLCDYRGLGEHYPFKFEADKVKGFTGVLANTDRGLSFLRCLPQKTVQERPLQELTHSQTLLRASSEPALTCRQFMRDLDEMNWDELEEKYLVPSLRYRLYIFARRVLGAKLFLHLGTVYKRLRGIRTSSWFLPSSND